TIDARKLAELLRAGLLSPVYHGQNSTAAVKHLGRSYAALTQDTTRIMCRQEAVWIAASARVVSAVKRERITPSRRATLPRTRPAARAAPPSPPRSDSGVSQA